MRWSTRLRTAPGAWLSPLVALALVLSTRKPTGEPYWVSRIVADAGAAVITTALCALAGALEGHRLRTVALTCDRVRPWWRVVMAPWVWSATVPTVLLTVLMSRHGFATHLLGWQVFGATVVSIWAWALAGIALGLSIPLAVAAPLALATPLAWVIFPPGMSIYWLRHLTGEWIDCCSVTQTLDPAVVAGTAAVNLGLLLASGLAVQARVVRKGRYLLLTTSIVVLAGGLVIGASQVNHMDAFPTRPREMALTCRPVTGTSARLCLLPEHEPQRSSVTAAMQRVWPVWARSGVQLPVVYSEQPVPDTTDAVAVSASPGLTDPSRVTAALASATVTYHCPAPTSGQQPVEVVEFAGRIDAWLRRVARDGGLEVSTDDLDPRDQKWADDLTARSAAVQRHTVSQMQDYLRACPR